MKERKEERKGRNEENTSRNRKKSEAMKEMGIKKENNHDFFFFTPFCSR